MNRFFFSKRRIFSKTAESTILWLISLDSMRKRESDGVATKKRVFLFLTLSIFYAVDENVVVLHWKGYCLKHFKKTGFFSWFSNDAHFSRRKFMAAFKQKGGFEKKTIRTHPWSTPSTLWPFRCARTSVSNYYIYYAKCVWHSCITVYYRYPVHTFLWVQKIESCKNAYTCVCLWYKIPFCQDFHVPNRCSDCVEGEQ